MVERVDAVLFTRRTCGKLLGILALGAYLLGPNLVLGGSGSQTVFRLRTRGTRECRTCKRHAWYKVFRTRQLADINRAHLGCNCPITEQRVSDAKFQQMFPDPTSPGVVDLRHVLTLPAPASLHGRVVLPGRGSFQGVTVILVGKERLAATTGGDGGFGFVQLVPGQYRLRAGIPGYLPIEGFVNLGAGPFGPHFVADFGRSGRTRTPDHRFWRPALYQLSYAPGLVPLEGFEPPTRDLGRRRSILTELQGPVGGDRGARTPNLGIANAALSQLSYIPFQQLQV